jgi:hypothetical protein
MRNKIIILLLVLFTVNIFAQDAGITDLDTGTVMADGDYFVGTDVSVGYDKKWQASVVRNYMFTGDITLGIFDNFTMQYGLFTSPNVSITGGVIDNVQIGSLTPRSGEFTSIRGTGSCEFNNVVPTGTSTTVGTSGDPFDNSYIDNMSAQTLTVGAVSNTELQLLDGTENKLL